MTGWVFDFVTPCTVTLEGHDGVLVLRTSYLTVTEVRKYGVLLPTLYCTPYGVLRIEPDYQTPSHAAATNGTE